MEGTSMNRSVPVFALFVSLAAAGGHQSEAQLNQYLAGAGAGYAKAAELNHYPGPLHLLELADQLALTPQQRVAIQELMDAHKAEARAIGARVVKAEGDLDQLFREGNASEAALAAAVRAAAATEGEYRLSHLETHRRTRMLLTQKQVERYDELRGYGTGGANAHRH
jgi:Spy/CpxP family protein refolding chaperone